MEDPNQSFDPTLVPLTNTIGKELLESSQKTTKSLFPARIYRVPEDLRELNKSAYIPRIISIGPHHRKEHLETPMQDVKKYYANYVFTRVTAGMNSDDQKRKKKTELLLKCVGKMKQSVDRAKKYYAEELKLDDDDMVKMMLVDGCFILELLYAYHTNKSKAAEEKTTNRRDSGNPKAWSSVQNPIDGGEDGSKSSSSGGGCEQPGADHRFDPIIDNILTANMIKQDLILLENQIPFFVLEELFELIVDKIPEENKLSSLTEYVVSYFDDIMRPEAENSDHSKTKTSCGLPDERVLLVYDSTKETEDGKKESSKANDYYYHILHFLHEYYLPKGENKDLPKKKRENKEPVEEKIEKKFIGLEVSASDLDFSGVKFVSVEGNVNLFDVNFKEHKGPFWWFCPARFEIPALVVHDPTEPLLRNLIALEQCCPGVRRYFTSYAKFMDMLISSKEDVKVLKKAKVICNHLGADKDVSDLFNKLCKEVVTGEFYFKDQYQLAYNYSKHRWPKLMAYWNRTYFSSPWRFRAVCVAIILFGMGLTQFIRSFLK
ncbi:UPF0481 protein At3g47200-like [Rhododendron vialii]|uniref:UPF0481 protein At3g47200-like n=1 Tax=Rhododendron vialii TaxID=182163 RepID=UPI00265EDF2D|nr:UPF0481 protein At3g47200-like [Rhododendron vialii]